jgi:hypothetical protein
MRHLLIAIVLVLTQISEATAAECKQDELSFDFSNIQVKKAFAIFADFAGLQAHIDQTIEQSEPMHFGCTNWREAAEYFARKHNLHLKIENGVMYVTK